RIVCDITLDADSADPTGIEIREPQCTVRSSDNVSGVRTRDLTLHGVFGHFTQCSNATNLIGLRLLNHNAPSGPAVILYGHALGVGNGYSVNCPDVVMRPI